MGCGNGAFTELIVQRCSPAGVDGVDPAEGQLAFARTRPASRIAKFKQGDAMALPQADKSFDVAVMALVIFFVPDPAKSVAEMVRVVRPGGALRLTRGTCAAADFHGSRCRPSYGRSAKRSCIRQVSDASRIDAMRQLWTDAGLTNVETREITVQRTFRRALMTSLSLGLTTPSIGPIVRAMPPSDVDTLKARLRDRLPADANGRITYSARANAVKGRVRK